MMDASADEVSLRAAVRRSVDMSPPATNILVACSGGPDSLALAAATAWLGDHGGPSVHAVVVDHQVQADSGSIADRAAQMCRRLGIPVEIARVVVSGDGGFEAAARRARYAALHDVAEQIGADAVLLGHTRDDQAETVLLRLLRGSGARSLAAMRPRDGLWRRPFLGLPRAQVQRVAAEVSARLGIPVWHDPHNTDPSFARVRVRSLLADWADGASASKGLARTAELLGDDADALEMWASAEAASCMDGADIRVDVIEGLPRAVRTRILRAWIIDAGSPPGDLDFDHVRSVDALICAWHGQGAVSVPGPLWVSRAYGRLRVSRAPKE